MSSRALINSAAAGVAVINAMYMVSEVPTGRAAWGWQMSAPAAADFTCAEGQVGCAGPTGCEAGNFTCTVTPKTGKHCDVTSISLQCSKNNATAKVPNEIACINDPNDHPNYTKDSELLWSKTPVCTDADDHDHSNHSTTDVASTTEAASTASGAQHVAAPALGMGSVLVAAVVAKVVV